MVTTPLSNLSKGFWNEAYTGNFLGCRCGCHGNYFERGSRGFTRALNKAYRLNPEIILCDDENELNVTAKRVEDDVDNGCCKAKGFGFSYNGKIKWIDIVLPSNTDLKTITLYD